MEVVTGIFEVLKEWGITGLLAGVVIFLGVMFVRGEIVSRQHVNQVQKTADSWQKAWEVAMQAQTSTLLMMERVNTLADTLEHLLKSLPNPDKDGDNR